MRYYKKNVRGSWETVVLSPEEAVTTRNKTIEMALKNVKKIREMSEEIKITISDADLCVILAKVTPCFESLANDLIEGQIKKAVVPIPNLNLKNLSRNSYLL